MSDFDRNRDLDPRDPRVDSRMRNDFGFGIPAAILAAVLIIGGIWYASTNRDVSTASNDRAPITRTAPPVTPAPTPTPAPAK